MGMQTKAAGAQGASVCAECGAEGAGNFCSACGADMRAGALGLLGDVRAPVRGSFPFIYLQILRGYGTMKKADAEQKAPKGAAATAPRRPSSERYDSREAEREAGTHMRAALAGRR